MSDPVLAHRDEPKVVRLIDSIVAVGNVPIPTGENATTLAIAQAFALTNERRNQLSAVHGKILMQAKRWQAEITGRHAEWQMKVADLYENDPNVRTAPSSTARTARAKALAVNEHRAVVEARREAAVWAAVLQVVENAQENLKLAKESLARLVSLMELQLQSDTLKPFRPHGGR